MTPASRVHEDFWKLVWPSSSLLSRTISLMWSMSARDQVFLALILFSLASLMQLE